MIKPPTLEIPICIWPGNTYLYRYEVRQCISRLTIRSSRIADLVTVGYSLAYYEIYLSAAGLFALGRFHFELFDTDVLPRIITPLRAIGLNPRELGFRCIEKWTPKDGRCC